MSNDSQNSTGLQPESPAAESDGTEWLLRLKGIFTRNLRLKMVALILTFAVYFWVGRDSETQIIVGVPLSLQVPESRVVTQVRPDVDRIKVRLRGRTTSLNRLNRANLQPVTVEIDPGDDNDQQISLTPRMVSTPPGTEVVSLDPSYLEVQLERRVTRTVSIQPQTTGQLRKAFELGQITVKPDSIEVSGPRSAIEPLRAIPTEPIDLDGRTETFDTEVRLRPTDRAITYHGPSRVSVHIPIEAQTVRRKFDELPVTVVNTTRPTSLSQQTVDLTVEGPRQVVEQLEADTLHGSIDMSGADERPAGTYEKKVQVRNLPDGVTPVRIHPTHFLVTLE